jgi:hypothetical protein
MGNCATCDVNAHDKRLEFDVKAYEPSNETKTTALTHSMLGMQQLMISEDTDLGKVI